MNYYLVQTKYFLIFIIIVCFTMSAIPFLKKSFADVSDVYARSHLKRIQGEMLFMSHKNGDFEKVCSVGTIGSLITELYKNSPNRILCRTNEPYNSKAVICSEMNNGSYQCVDSQGISCEIGYYPQNNYTCKELH